MGGRNEGGVVNGMPTGASLLPPQLIPLSAESLAAHSAERPSPRHTQNISSESSATTVVSTVLLVGLALTPALFTEVVSCKQWFIEGGAQGVFMAALLPYAPFCIACGYVWGFTGGMLVQTLAILLSSGCIYGIGRVMKHSLPLAVRRNREWTKLLLEIDHDWRKAAKINLLLCFIPMPYGKLPPWTHAYIFALSEHAFLTFVVVFEFGMIGHTLLNLGIGHVLSCHGEAAAHPLKTWGAAASISVMLVATWFAGVVAQRQLEDGLEPDDIGEVSPLSSCSSSSLESLLEDPDAGP
ncbi:hypothetical protein T484DRAFT_1809021 [Baffinella frigidus]|nr:hypothetical protein T484DRAFT_1809021 [Cryptophyta sp. CCMP2293]